MSNERQDSASHNNHNNHNRTMSGSTSSDGRSTDSKLQFISDDDLRSALIDVGITHQRALMLSSPTDVAEMLDVEDSVGRMLVEAAKAQHREGSVLGGDLSGRIKEDDVDSDPQNVLVIAGQDFVPDGTDREAPQEKIRELGQALDAVGWDPTRLGVLDNGGGRKEMGGLIAQEYVQMYNMAMEGLLGLQVFGTKWDDTEGEPDFVEPETGDGGSKSLSVRDDGTVYWDDAPNERNYVAGLWADAVLIIEPDSLTHWMENEGFFDRTHTEVVHYHRSTDEKERQEEDDTSGLTDHPSALDRGDHRLTRWDNEHRDHSWSDSGSAYYLGPAEFERTPTNKELRERYEDEGDGEPTSGKKDFTSGQ